MPTPPRPNPDVPRFTANCKRAGIRSLFAFLNQGGISPTDAAHPLRAGLTVADNKAVDRTLRWLEYQYNKQLDRDAKRVAAKDAAPAPTPATA